MNRRNCETAQLSQTIHVWNSYIQSTPFVTPMQPRIHSILGLCGYIRLISCCSSPKGTRVTWISDLGSSGPPRTALCGRPSSPPSQGDVADDGRRTQLADLHAAGDAKTGSQGGRRRHTSCRGVEGMRADNQVSFCWPEHGQWTIWECGGCLQVLGGGLEPLMLDEILPTQRSLWLLQDPQIGEPPSGVFPWNVPIRDKTNCGFAWSLMSNPQSKPCRAQHRAPTSQNHLWGDGETQPHVGHPQHHQHQWHQQSYDGVDNNKNHKHNHNSNHHIIVHLCHIFTEDAKIKRRDNSPWVGHVPPGPISIRHGLLHLGRCLASWLTQCCHHTLSTHGDWREQQI